MIVRILNEDQYRMEESLHPRLNELDNAVVAAVEAGDEDGFHAAFEELLAFIRDNGTPLEADDLHGSDVIIPPADSTIVEAAADFTGDGLIPD